MPRLTPETRWRLAALAVTVLAFTLRVANLGGQSLWYDEAYTLLVARRPLGELLAAVASDTNQPLGFLLLHLWGAGGASEFYLRFPSVLGGAVAVPLAFAAGRLLLGPGPALAGAALLAVAPFPLFYSQELRMYGELMAWCGLAGFGCAVGWRRRSRTGWALYALGTAGALYTHLLGALPCLALAGWVVLAARGQGQTLRAPLIALGVAGLAFLPWAVLIPAQASTVLTTFWAGAPTLLSPFLSLYRLLFGPFLAAGWMAPLLGVLLLALALTLLPLLHRTPPDAAGLGLLWVWLAAPIAGLLAVSLVRSVYLDRVLVGCALPLCLLLGWAATRVRPRPVALALGVVLAGASCWGTVVGLADPAAGKPAYALAARAVTEQAAPGEPVLHTSDGSLLPFLIDAPGLHNVLLAGDPEHQQATSRARSTLVTMGQIPQPLEAAVGSAASFWLVVSLDHSTEYQQTVVAAVEQQYRRTGEIGGGGLFARRYAR